MTEVQPDPQLSEDELGLLRSGLLEWSGPARCTDEFAVAMGFRDSQSMAGECRRLRRALTAGGELEPLDWTRALLATEIAFASDVVGSGFEWRTTTGLSDSETVSMLRSVQRKLAGIVASVVGKGLGTRPAEF